MRKHWPGALVASAFMIAAVVWSLEPGRTTPPVAAAERAAESKEAARPFGIEKRTPWTTSKVAGTPEPPPPYLTERIFPKLSFDHPTLFAVAPGSSRIFVGEQAGKLYSFPNDQACEQADLVIDLAADLKFPPDGPHTGSGAFYGLAFHPKFEENRYVYLCFTVGSRQPGQPPDGTRVSRFVIPKADPPRIDPASEQIIITWLGGGHNGGCLEFSPKDGKLYISTGDGSFPNPPDALLAGQDVTNLLSAILRIDVDRPTETAQYSIPPDNPFVVLEVPNARREIWAYGFRNPWKMTFDRQTGELFAGDVGWELYEMIHYIVGGGNYGWSIMEGPQSVRTELPPGPTPILPAAIALPHSDAASVTGGYVYRGKKLPGLVGKYVFGDWETRRMWAATFEKEKVVAREEIVPATIRVSTFGEDHDGEIYALDYDDGSINRFIENPDRGKPSSFPTKLSETGLFASLAEHVPADGVVPFSINAEMWSDGAQAERFIAVPETGSVVLHPQNVPVPGTIMQTKLVYPPGTVLLKTLTIGAETLHPRRVETQLSHFDGKVWRGYSYRWNADQTDADLVPAEGATAAFDFPADGAKPARQETWEYASRAACVRCHNPWAQHTLAFNAAQLNKPHAYHGGSAGLVADQLRTLEHIGLVVPPAGQTLDPAALPKLFDPHDASHDLDKRARSWLQANCAHCHQMGGGGTADIDLKYDTKLENTKTLGIRPLQGAFGIHDASIIAPSDPFKSILFYRISKTGRGRMPHLGSEVADEAGIRLIHDWIRQIPVRHAETVQLDRLREIDDEIALPLEAANQPQETALLVLEFARNRKRETPNDDDRKEAVAEQARRAGRRAADRAKERPELIAKLLATPHAALHLVRYMQTTGLPAQSKQAVLAAATTNPEPAIRDLFTPLLPPDQRPKTLGTVVRPAELLALAGDAARGRDLFFKTQGVQCKTCHKIGEEGGQVGPDLSQIGKKYTKAQLLESLLEPSKFIEPKFVTYLVETTKGQVHTGLLVERTEKEVVLRDAQAKDIRIPTADVEEVLPQRLSLMPELLLRDLTAAQVADLLEYLSGLKPSAD